jgi:hypothetical protein
MAVFSRANLEAVGGRDKIRLCPRCGLSLEYIAGQGYCCPRGHGCWWPAEEREPPEDKKARCYHQGEVKKPSSPSKGRKRKKQTPKERWTSDYVET